ncbi:MAG: MBL fold metallo-hydrolase [Gammaproteobacteria bacterium]
MSFTVRYIYSACVVIETPDVRILCDPWFTQGIYDGSWFQYPRIADPVEVIGPVDIVFISHIHPDHYDPKFLHAYLARYPGTRVIISSKGSPHLGLKMKIDRITAEAVEDLQVGATRLTVVPNGAYDVNIDTALVVSHGTHSVVNMNDNPFDEAQIERVLAACPDGRPSFALLPYAGAGPYPQTFAFPSPEKLREAADRKRRQFLDLFRRYTARLNPVRCMPFAGKYFLGGSLASLNPHRGVPDAVEALAEDARALLLADGGHARYDLETREASAVRTERYDPAALELFLRELGSASFEYEKELDFSHRSGLPFVPLLMAAREKARRKVKIAEPYWLCIQPTGSSTYFVFNVAGEEPVAVRASLDESVTPRAEIQIDPRYLFGLLTRLYHWNNAEIGSHYRTRRVPDVFIRQVYDFLDMLQV